MNGAKIVFIIVGVWMGAQALSFILPSLIDGPRNIDTGFKRLDVFARLQLLAFGLALIAALAGFLAAQGRGRLVGLAPLGLTLLAGVGLYLFVILGNKTPQPTTPAPQTVPVPTPQAEE